MVKVVVAAAVLLSLLAGCSAGSDVLVADGEIDAACKAVDHFLTTFDEKCQQECTPESGIGRKLVELLALRDSQGILSTYAYPYNDIRYIINASEVINSDPPVMSRESYAFARKHITGGHFYHRLPECATCEWAAGECTGGLDPFTPGTASCSSECEAHAVSLGADEGSLMAGPLEAVRACAGDEDWFAAYTDLVGYVAGAWYRWADLCDPLDDQEWGTGFPTDDSLDRMCQLGGVCAGTVANCRKIERFHQRLDTACPKQCDAGGNKNGLPACKEDEPERTPATCGGRGNDQPTISHAGAVYKGCLEWIESGLTTSDMPDGNAGICDSKDDNIDSGDSNIVHPNIYGAKLADIWSACDGNGHQATRDFHECRLNDGLGCAGDLASVNFKAGYVWTSVGYTLVEAFLEYYPGAAVGSAFTLEHFNALNWDQEKNDRHYRTMFKLQYSWGYIQPYLEFIEGYVWAKTPADSVLGEVKAGDAFTKAHLEAWRKAMISSASLRVGLGLKANTILRSQAATMPALLDEEWIELAPGPPVCRTVPSAIEVAGGRAITASATLSELIAANGGSCASVEVGQGTVVTITANAEIPGALVVKGAVRCDAGAGGFHLRVGAVVVDGSNDDVETDGLFECDISGSADAEVKIELLGDKPFSNPAEPTSATYKAISVQNKGTLRLTGHGGSTGTYRMRRLAEPAAKGSDEIVLRPSPFETAAPWKKGDEIVVATTSFYRQQEMALFENLPEKYDAKHGPDQNERRTIVDVSWRRDSDSRTVITLDKPLDYDHYGRNPQVYTNPKTGEDYVLDEAAYVVNLNRNLKICGSVPGNTDGGIDTRSEVEIVTKANGVGGHVIVQSGSRAYVESVELYHMGQMGRMGRYPLHWHLLGEGGQGQYVKHTSIHDTFQRCAVVHGTNNVLLDGNLCFNIFGHGFFLEDGNEVNNRFEANIAILVKKMPSDRALLESEFVDEDILRFPSPSAYWIAHPTNAFVRNVAIASEGTGFWSAFVGGTCCEPGSGSSCRVVEAWVPSGDECSASETLIKPNRAKLLQFDANEASSCLVGMNWDGAPYGMRTNTTQKGARNPRWNGINAEDHSLEVSHFTPPEVPVFKDNVMYKNSARSFYLRGQLTVWEGMVVADNAEGPLWAYETILRNSASIGWSRNAEVDFFFDKSIRPSSKAGPPIGLMVYDGPLLARGMLLAGFPSHNVLHTPRSGSACASAEGEGPKEYVWNEAGVAFIEGHNIQAFFPGAQLGSPVTDAHVSSLNWDDATQAARATGDPGYQDREQLSSATGAFIRLKGAPEYVWTEFGVAFLAEFGATFRGTYFLGASLGAEVTNLHVHNLNWDDATQTTLTVADPNYRDRKALASYGPQSYIGLKGSDLSGSPASLAYVWLLPGVAQAKQHPKLKRIPEIYFNARLTQRQFDVINEGFTPQDAGYKSLQDLADESMVALDFGAPERNDVTPRVLGLQGADERFFAGVESLSYRYPESPGFKTGFDRNGATQRAGAGFQAAFFLDPSGDFSGKAGSTVVTDSSFNFVPGCERVPDMPSALRCSDLDPSALYFYPKGVREDGFVRVARTKIGDHPSSSSPMHTTDANLGLFQNKDQSYHIVDWILSGHVADPMQHKLPGDSTMSLTAIKYVANAVGGVSPPIYFWGNGGCKSESTNLHFPGLGPVDTEDGILRGAGALASGGVYHGAGYTIVRFKASSSRYGPQWGPVNFPANWMYAESKAPYPAELSPDRLPGQAFSINRICCGQCTDAFVSTATGADVVDFGESQLYQFTTQETAGKLTMSGVACAKGSSAKLELKLIHRGDRSTSLWNGTADQQSGNAPGSACPGGHGFSVEVDIAALEAAGMPAGAATGASLLDLDLIAELTATEARTRIPLSAGIVVDNRLQNLKNGPVYVSCDKELRAMPELQEIMPPEMTDCQVTRYEKLRAQPRGGASRWQQCSWADQSRAEKQAAAAATVTTVLEGAAAGDTKAEAVVLTETPVATSCEALDIDAAERDMCAAAEASKLYTASAGAVCSVFCKNAGGARRRARSDSATVSLVVVGQPGTITPATVGATTSEVAVPLRAGGTVAVRITFAPDEVTVVPIDLDEVDAQAATVSWRDYVAEAVAEDEQAAAEPPLGNEIPETEPPETGPETDRGSGSAARRRGKRIVALCCAAAVVLNQV